MQNEWDSVELFMTLMESLGTLATVLFFDVSTEVSTFCAYQGC